MMLRSSNAGQLSEQLRLNRSKQKSKTSPYFRTQNRDSVEMRGTKSSFSSKTDTRRSRQTTEDTDTYEQHIQVII